MIYIKRRMINAQPRVTGIAEVSLVIKNGRLMCFGYAGNFYAAKSIVTNFCHLELGVQ